MIYLDHPSFGRPQLGMEPFDTICSLLRAPGAQFLLKFEEGTKCITVPTIGSMCPKDFGVDASNVKDFDSLANFVCQVAGGGATTPAPIAPYDPQAAQQAAAAAAAAARIQQQVTGQRPAGVGRTYAAGSIAFRHPSGSYYIFSPDVAAMTAALGPMPLPTFAQITQQRGTQASALSFLQKKMFGGCGSCGLGLPPGAVASPCGDPPPGYVKVDEVPFLPAGMADAGLLCVHWYQDWKVWAGIGVAGVLAAWLLWPSSSAPRSSASAA